MKRRISIFETVAGPQVVTSPLETSLHVLKQWQVLDRRILKSSIIDKCLGPLAETKSYCKWGFLNSSNNYQPFWAESLSPQAETSP